ncbi:MAG: hypothetical protein CMI09_05505 [Oceanospirillaceae bacterium]|nr:hypothetical protein [Oceanospirillaceae bacterium]
MDDKDDNNDNTGLNRTMNIATSWARHKEPDQAARIAVECLTERLTAAPHQVIAFYTEDLDSESLRLALALALPQSQIHGCSSCGGFMTEEGMFEPDEEGGVLGLWGMYDEGGSFGSALAELDDDPVAGAQAALIEAIDVADRAGEAPEMIWLTATPGNEERIIEGLQQLVGTNIPIQGGSAGDNQVSGNWSIFSQSQCSTQGVAVTVMYPGGRLSPIFHNGYSPTSHQATITRADDRVLYELDGEPAAEVYNRWTGGAIGDFLESGGNVLGSTTLFPLGREVDQIDNQVYYNLSHPETVTDDGALTLFSSVEEGEQLVLLEGSVSSLIKRAGRVAASAMEVGNITGSELAGGLAIYCAGCRLTVGDTMDSVVTSIQQATSGKPFIGGFTFGEQGCFLNGDNRHGNLMISYVAFAGNDQV